MGYVDFETLSKQNTSEANNNGVGFFSLKNDGDEAIVRFMYDDTKSFEVLATHSIQVNGKFRRISCISTPNQPLTSCPFCEKGEKVDYRFFIHLLQYTKNPDGSVSVEPKVWERSISYANKLKEYLNNYGPLSDVICKIVRHGKAGDMKTDYEIIPNLSKQVYRDEVFVKKTGCFDNYKALGRVVLDKNVGEIKEYFATGNFPMKEKEEQKAPEGFTQVVTSGDPVWGDKSPNWGSTDDLPKWSVEEAKTNTAPNWNDGSTTGNPPRNFNWTTSDNQQVSRPTRF